MATSVAALRALIQQRFPDATPLTGGAQTTEQVATGIEALDKVLPNGGLPRGRLSVWAPQGGATAILRATCHSVVANGERSAWIDGDNTVAGAFWGDGTRPVPRAAHVAHPCAARRRGVAAVGRLFTSRISRH